VRVNTEWFVALLGIIGLTVFEGCGGGSHASTQSNCATQAGAATATYTGTAHATSHVIDVEARDYAFHPTCVLDVPTGTVTLVVHNVTAQLHNVQIADQHIDRDVNAGATVSIPVRIASSPVVFVCRYHRALGMAGALIPAASPARKSP